MLLAVQCSWEGRRKMDIIRLSVQSEPHGSGCTSLKDTFMGSNKKARKPCRVTYSGGYDMKSHGLWVWLTIMTLNQDLSFALKSHLFLAYMTCTDRPPLDSLGKVHCLQVYLNWWCTINIPVLSILYHSGDREGKERKGNLVLRYGQNGKLWSGDQEGINSEFVEQIIHHINYRVKDFFSWDCFLSYNWFVGFFGDLLNPN